MYKLEKNIPAPKMRWGSIKKLLDVMEQGESFLCEIRCQPAISAYGKKTGKTFTTKREGVDAETGYSNIRVWRIA